MKERVLFVLGITAGLYVAFNVWNLFQAFIVTISICLATIIMFIVSKGSK